MIGGFRRKRSNTKILIVDDSATWAFLVQEMLEAGGHEVMRAGDGAAGYGTYLLFRPDLVISDIEMPEKSGLEMTAHLRAYNPGIEVIYMSADLERYRSQLEEEKRKYGVGLLQKPFSRMELMKLIAAKRKGGERKMGPRNALR